MNHLEFHEYEMSFNRKSCFEIWADKVERIIGRDLDGDQEIDGYSLDFALKAFQNGSTPEQYANSI